MAVMVLFRPPTRLYFVIWLWQTEPDEKKNAVFTQFYTTLDVYSSTQQGELEGLLNGRKLHHFLTPKTRHSLITLGRKQK